MPQMDMVVTHLRVCRYGPVNIMDFWSRRGSQSSATVGCD